MQLSRIAIPLVALALFSGPAGADKKPSKPRIEIKVTEKGFEPESIKVPARTALTLVFVRKTDATCTKSVVMTLDGKTVEHDLPLNKAVEIAATFPKAGKLGYACSMDMSKGTIVVQ